MTSDETAQPARATARRPFLALAFALIFAAGVYWNVRLWFDLGHGGVDFNQFYSASKLAGTGHLYDWDALTALEAQHGPIMPTGRLPVVVFALKPLTWLPYDLARSVWLILSVAALLGVCFAWPGINRRALLLGCAWSGVAVYTIAEGQDTVFWMLFFASAVAFLEAGRPRSAGAMFALCICKFHLGIAIPVILIAQKRWTALITGALTTAALVTACFAIEGPFWLREYRKMAVRPDFSPGSHDMVNLNGLASWVSGAPWVELSAAVVCLILLWFTSRLAPVPALASASAMASGLLVGHHAYVGDCVLLLPLGAIVVSSTRYPLWFRGWACLMLTPWVMFAVISLKPFIGQTAIVAFVFLSMVLAIRQGKVRAATTNPASTDAVAAA